MRLRFLGRILVLDVHVVLLERDLDAFLAEAFLDLDQQVRGIGSQHGAGNAGLHGVQRQQGGVGERQAGLALFLLVAESQALLQLIDECLDLRS